jgi:hypothetical protein
MSLINNAHAGMQRPSSARQGPVLHWPRLARAAPCRLAKRSACVDLPAPSPHACVLRCCLIAPTATQQRKIVAAIITHFAYVRKDSLSLARPRPRSETFASGNTI